MTYNFDSFCSNDSPVYLLHSLWCSLLSLTPIASYLPLNNNYKIYYWTVFIAINPLLLESALATIHLTLVSFSCCCCLFFTQYKLVYSDIPPQHKCQASGEVAEECETCQGEKECNSSLWACRLWISTWSPKQVPVWSHSTLQPLFPSYHQSTKY